MIQGFCDVFRLIWFVASEMLGWVPYVIGMAAAIVAIAGGVTALVYALV